LSASCRSPTAIALALGMVGADEDAVRVAPAGLDDARLQAVLAPREWEALQMGARERVTDTELPHIRDLPAVLPGCFAARRCARAMPASTASNCTTPMPTPWPPSFRRPTRATMAMAAALPSARACRWRCSPRCGRRSVAAIRVGCRMLSEECIEGGSGIDDAVFFALKFAQAGMDFLSFSRGGKFDDAKQPKVGDAVYPYTGVSGYECMPGYLSDEKGPFGRNLDATRALREALRDEGLATPVVAAGGIHNFEQAERVLADGIADIVGSARQSLADPGWWKKLRDGRGARCISANTRTTAKASTRSTRRSPASSGIASPKDSTNVPAVMRSFATATAPPRLVAPIGKDW
jgi:hypothetical protein